MMRKKRPAKHIETQLRPVEKNVKLPPGLEGRYISVWFVGQREAKVHHYVSGTVVAARLYMEDRNRHFRADQIIGAYWRKKLLTLDEWKTHMERGEA